MRATPVFLLVSIIVLIVRRLARHKTKTILFTKDLIVDDNLIKELNLSLNEHLSLFGNSKNESIIIQAKQKTIGELYNEKKLYEELLTGNLKCWIIAINDNIITAEFKFFKT